jgi:GxxExxY protein
VFFVSFVDKNEGRAFGGTTFRRCQRSQTIRKSAMEIIHKDESYSIMGACFEVYREMGCGFTEPIYQECLELEFAIQAIPHQANRRLKLNYKGRRLKKVFEPDFVCYELIVVEIKALSRLTNKHRAQVLNYLKATGLKLGLLVNFGSYPKVEYERIVR